MLFCRENLHFLFLLAGNDRGGGKGRRERESGKIAAGEELCSVKVCRLSSRAEKETQTPPVLLRKGGVLV